jgi:hypothetical protein
LDLEALRLDQLQILLGMVLGVEREIIGRAEALVERAIGPELGLARLVGLGPDFGQLGLLGSLQMWVRCVR